MPSPRLVTRTSGRPRRRARAISMSGLASGVSALGRRHEAADRRAALLEVLDHLVEIGEGAEHRHAADRLAEIVGPTVGQDALGLDLLDRAGLDGAQDHLDVAAAPEQQGRRVGIALQGLARAGVLRSSGRRAGPPSRNIWISQ